MTDPLEHAVAIVGVGAILPDAPDADTFWRNVTGGVSSISEVDPARWDPALYYDQDPKASEKTYSTIGGWVRDWDWSPLAWKLPIPPKVSEAMDDAHKWAVACTRMALMDAGWPARELDLDRTAVIIGNAMSGERHYLTTLRIMFPSLARELERTDSFAALPADVRATIEQQLRARFEDWLPGITEDTMPGELGNCIAGRVANLFNLHGPNFTTDAACASALAAMDATVDGLLDARVRCRDHRRHRPQHGCEFVRQVLRHRCPLADRHAALRRRRRRLRDGRRRGVVRRQAARRRRA